MVAGEGDGGFDLRIDCEGVRNGDGLGMASDFGGFWVILVIY